MTGYKQLVGSLFLSLLACDCDEVPEGVAESNEVFVQNADTWLNSEIFEHACMEAAILYKSLSNRW